MPLKDSIHDVDVIKYVKHGTELTGMLLRIELCESSVDFCVSPSFVFE